MFDNDELIRQALIDPEQTWELLDSFWRAETDTDTRDLVHYQAWAALLAELNVHARAQHFLRAQTVPDNGSGFTQEAFLSLPWFPIILFEDRIIQESTVQYGDGYIYSPIPDIVYGQQTGDPDYLVVFSRPFRELTMFCDAVTNTSVVIDQSQFSYDAESAQIVFDENPFSLITPRLDQGSGRSYIVLWARNPKVDLDVPFDWTGWVVKYDRLNIPTYLASLKQIWEMVLLGPSIGRYKKGLTAACGFPYALRDGEIEWVTTDGSQLLISDGEEVYKADAATVSAVVTGGDTVVDGQPLTDGVKFLEYPDTLSATFAELPGLVIKVPLSTGVSAKLSFANIATEWTYDSLATPAFQFPVGGDTAEVQQFWVDVNTYAVANGIDLQTVYGLSIPGGATPGIPEPTGDAVNPMTRIIQDLLHNSLFVASVDLANLPAAPGGFHDRARLLLPKDVLIVLHQFVGAVSDAYDLDANTTDSVSYGYHTTATTETISVPGGGTDLTYYDYVPLVVIS